MHTCFKRWLNFPNFSFAHPNMNAGFHQWLNLLAFGSAHPFMHARVLLIAYVFMSDPSSVGLYACVWARFWSPLYGR